MQPIPTVFLSHGAPSIALEPDDPAYRFFQGLGSRYPGVKAVLCISAHWSTEKPAVNSVEKPRTIHDFSGFPEELYSITYPAPGSPDLAGRTSSLLSSAGIPCGTDTNRGLDHGAWIPLMLMSPGADVPVVQLSIQGHLDPGRHLTLGRALAPLRDEGVLVIGSGGNVHPLGDPTLPLGEGLPTDPRAAAFATWLDRVLATGDTESLIRYRELAPAAVHAQPYPDHFMPLLAAMGVAGPGARGALLHDSWYWGNLGMAAYEFR